MGQRPSNSMPVLSFLALLLNIQMDNIAEEVYHDPDPYFNQLQSRKYFHQKNGQCIQKVKRLQQISNSPFSLSIIKKQWLTA